MSTSVLLGRMTLVVAAAVSVVSRVLSPAGSVATLVEAPTGRFLVPGDDVFSARRIGRPAGHDAAVLRAAMAATGPASEVLVVEAHVGAHAIPLVADGRGVAVVEANPTTFEPLVTNAQLNGVEFVGARQAAARRSPGVVRFLASASNTGGSKVHPQRGRFEYVYDRPTEIVVERVRLDDWGPARSMSAPLLVIDIEGSGPAKLCQALGIDRDQDGVDLVAGGDVGVLDDGTPPPPTPGVSARIGISVAVDEPWRWFVPGDPNLSRPG